MKRAEIDKIVEKSIDGIDIMINLALFSINNDYSLDVYPFNKIYSRDVIMSRNYSISFFPKLGDNFRIQLFELRSGAYNLDIKDF